MVNGRNTKQKQLILSILRDADKPLSINEIYQKMIAALPKVAKSTIYRNIDQLLGQNLIDKYYLNDNEIFYRIKNYSSEHKHYVVCDDCKKTFDLPVCPIHDLEQSMADRGFIIKDHMIQTNGICNNCATRKELRQRKHLQQREE